jgi:hypothetical protein
MLCVKVKVLLFRFLLVSRKWRRGKREEVRGKRTEKRELRREN